VPDHLNPSDLQVGERQPPIERCWACLTWRDDDRQDFSLVECEFDHRSHDQSLAEALPLTDTTQTTPPKGQACSTTGRFNTDDVTKSKVWALAAGHCELCGDDLTRDVRIGAPLRWGHVAHILPASPKGPRGGGDHDATQAEAKSNDPDNLMPGSRSASAQGLILTLQASI
jgi:hypothetical protein